MSFDVDFYLLTFKIVLATFIQPRFINNVQTFIFYEIIGRRKTRERLEIIMNLKAFNVQFCKIISFKRFYI